MKAVLLTGAGIAVVDGIVLGVSLGVGATGVAATALVVGLAAAVVLAWLTPDARQVQRSTVTLAGHAHPAHLAVDDAAVQEGQNPGAPAPEPQPELAPAPALTPLAV